MMNSKEQVLGCEKTNGNAQANEGERFKRSCTDCRTTRTPLWRGGPAGPRSLCNACGIRYRKQRSALVGLGKTRGEKKKNNKKSGSSGSSELVSVKLRLMALGRDMVLQRPLLESGQQIRILGEEEEEAAILLMALSSGSLYA